MTDEDLDLIDEAVLMARNFYDTVCDIEEALMEGEINEASDALTQLKSKMSFLIRANNLDDAHKKKHKLRLIH